MTTTIALRVDLILLVCEIFGLCCCAVGFFTVASLINLHLNEIW